MTLETMKKNRFNGLDEIIVFEKEFGWDGGERADRRLKCSILHEKGCRRDFYIGITLLCILNKTGI